MAYSYAIRIHVDCMGEDGLDKLRALLNDIGGGYLFVREHDANRTHIQGWLTTEAKQQAIRARIKRWFPGVVGNRGYSLKVVKHMEAYQDYCLKGTVDELADVVASHSLELNEEFLKTAHRRYWSRHVGTSKGSIVKQVHEWACSITDVSKSELVERVCTVITSMNKPLMVPYVVGVVNSVMFKLEGSRKDVLIDHIVRLLPE